MKKKGNEVLLTLVTAKLLSIAAREIVPFVLSVLVRSGIKKFLKSKKDLAKPTIETP